MTRPVLAAFAAAFVVFAAASAGAAEDKAGTAGDKGGAAADKAVPDRAGAEKAERTMIYLEMKRLKIVTVEQVGKIPNQLGKDQPAVWDDNRIRQLQSYVQYGFHKKGDPALADFEGVPSKYMCAALEDDIAAFNSFAEEFNGRADKPEHSPSLLHFNLNKQVKAVCGMG